MNVKNIMFAVGGALIGSAGTYFYMRKKTEDIINKEVYKESIAVRKYYEEKFGLSEETAKENAEKEQPKEDLDDEPNEPDYSKYRTETIEIPDEVVTQQYEDPDFGRVRRITEEEFDEDFRYSKENLIYYEEDAVLTDETDYPVLVEDTIVDEALLDFDDTDRVYIRNSEIGIDYQVEVERRRSVDPSN